jgi:holo-[acyl-carrier protein] synthase
MNTLSTHAHLLGSITKKENTNVYSVGIDITSVSLFEKFLNDESLVFFKKHFTENELTTVKLNLTNPDWKSKLTSIALRLAARYAAKEAFVKAIDGKRLFQQRKLIFNYQEVEVLNDNYGRPYMNILGKCKTYLKSVNVCSIQVSLSHEESLSVAVVLLLKDLEI